ncbi:CarD family transcriptional regulator [Papillibacter cinnamivorans]|uniref:Transcriptional regulator, CarD family n=1 Tax=Papillibacter cinnamivorans DSM 12816 TaxID=1122930 RepID=A0A1W2C9I8_9FIRM|nr:CarD family transcriptional regulator [Papillibacter cinnamivorans]SMC81830.1 transcriptional regulator, CarD family [Papillibacter cinnamivorans DSM 12816]
MFKTGDLVLYGGTGVCRVTEITQRDLQGAEGNALYYILKPLYSNYIVSTPVDTEKVVIRPILTKTEAEQLIDRIPSFHPKPFYSRMIREVAEHYEAHFKTYCCADLMELSISLYAKKQESERQNRKFGLVDERYMKRTEELLFGELAAALGILKEEVPSYITARVGKKGGEPDGKCDS